MPFITDDNESNLANLGERSNLSPNAGGQGSYTPPDPNTDPRATWYTPNPNPRGVPPEVPGVQMGEGQPPKTPADLKAEALSRKANRPIPKRPMDVFGPFEQTNIPKANGVVGTNYFLDINAQETKAITNRLQFK